jgi:TPR repeat protein
MKSSHLISSLAFIGLLMWTLDLSAAEFFPLGSRVSAPRQEILAAGRSGVSRMPSVQDSELDQRELSALNLLGIQYVKGRGVKRNPLMAMRYFLRSAMHGYTPAMANIGTLYENGATGHTDLRRAYAWVRTALAFGVPDEGHDTTVFKLGMLAARLGSDNIEGAERLAEVLASGVVETCECSPTQATELAFNGPP